MKNGCPKCEKLPSGILCPSCEIDFLKHEMEVAEHNLAEAYRKLKPEQKPEQKVEVENADSK